MYYVILTLHTEIKYNYKYLQCNSFHEKLDLTQNKSFEF